MQNLGAVLKTLAQLPHDHVVSFIWMFCFEVDHTRTFCPILRGLSIFSAWVTLVRKAEMEYSCTWGHWTRSCSCSQLQTGCTITASAFSQAARTHSWFYVFESWPRAGALTYCTHWLELLSGSREASHSGTIGPEIILILTGPLLQFSVWNPNVKNFIFIGVMLSGWVVPYLWMCVAL